MRLTTEGARYCSKAPAQRAGATLVIGITCGGGSHEGCQAKKWRRGRINEDAKPANQHQYCDDPTGDDRRRDQRSHPGPDQ